MPLSETVVFGIITWEFDSLTDQIRYGEIDTYPPNVNKWREVLHPEDRQAFREWFNHVPYDFEAGDLEFRALASTGNVRNLLLRGRPRATDSEHNPGAIGVLIDVTGWCARFREKLRILENVLLSIGDGVVVANAEGKFTTFNPAAERLLGSGPITAAPEEWSQRYSIFFSDGITPFPSEQLPLVRALRGEETDNLDLFVRRENGDGIHLSSTARPLRSEDGALTGGVTVLRDVSERKRSEQLLRTAIAVAEAANHAKSEFLSRMSHELRTGLNSILSYEQILQTAQLPSHSGECVQRIMHGAKHLVTLIEEVVELSCMEAGRLALSSEPVELRQLLAETFGMVQPIAAPRGIKIYEEGITNEPLYVIADGQRLQQVVLNLLSNAIKYNSQNGRVEVYCEERRRSRVRMSVRDTGPGISAQDQCRLFLPFERLNADKTKIQGTGLGLALSRRLIESMGGVIGVDSVLGSGSTFWIELPLAGAPLERLRREGVLSSGPLEGPMRHGTVLYVEDNVENLRLMERIVAYRPQLRLIAAPQGLMAFPLAIGHLPDVIFIDLHLPDMPGDKILKQLKNDSRTSHIPVVMLSANATPDQINMFLAAGASAYLTKPLDIQKLLGVLGEHLNADSYGQHELALQVR